MNKLGLFIIFLFITTSQLIGGEQPIRHNLTVSLFPEQQSLTAVDSMIFPGVMAGKKIHFLIHQGITIDAPVRDIKMKKIGGKIKAADFGETEEKFILPEAPALDHYSLVLPEPKNGVVPVVLRYSGKIFHPVQQVSEEYARGFSETPGIISAEGIYLAGSSYWIPWFNSGLINFNLEVTLPGQWDIVSQGQRTRHEIKNDKRIVRWESPELMEEIYLIAAPFIEYQRQQAGITAMAFLRTADDALARKYLETTAQYLEMYNRLIGPYPYSKFALVENFWETGYGMPSFTLLGQKVIRFPFILHSSYPHELLHNWWGNGVYVDYDSGNWCEGLTVFMADHLIKEQRGQGVDYRRTALQAYTDYVNTKNEFPLKDFKSRRDASSSAIGYNKSMMIFNMLRQDLGDTTFVKAIQLFYKTNKFRQAGFADIQKAFEAVSRKDLTAFFRQWIQRSGAPMIQVSQVVSDHNEDGYYLYFNLKQTQSGDAYQLEVPVAIHVQGKKQAAMQMVSMTKKEEQFKIIYKDRPLLVEIDPQFDLFRKLYREETPPALSQVFGAENILIILPVQEDPNKKEAYAQLAAEWTKNKSEQFEIVSEADLAQIPADKSVWVFGLNNPHKLWIVKGLEKYNARVDRDTLYTENAKLSLADHSFTLTVENPNNPDKVMAWLAADDIQAIPGLGRKLPHYAKYSYLGFEGSEPTNILQGQWPALNSPLRAVVFQADGSMAPVTEGSLPGRNPLAELKPLYSTQRMEKDIRFLAGADLRGRGLGTEGLDRAAEYLADQFHQAGLMPAGDNGTYLQTWQEIGGKDSTLINLQNIIGFIPGAKKGWEEQSVVLCAHYDHLGLGWPDVHSGNEGKIHFGADDNASGVAVLLELARVLAATATPDRNIIFLAVTGEESGLRGSKYYLKMMKKFPAQKIIGVLNLDTVGRLYDKKLIVLNGNSASEWKHIIMGVGFVTGIPYELVTQPLDASDQVAFIESRIPAIQLFSGAHADYHRPEDTADKIDLAGLVKVASFSKEVMDYLSAREEPLTFMSNDNLKTSSLSSQTAGPRKVSTGVMPDFTYSGEGVKITELAEDSPAAKAGIKSGDVIIKLAGITVKNLKEYSDVLRQFKPGDELDVVYVRDNKEYQATIRLEPR